MRVACAVSKEVVGLMRAGLCGKLEGVGALAKHDKKYAYLESKTSKHGPFHCARIQAEESLPNAHAARI